MQTTIINNMYDNTFIVNQSDNVLTINNTNSEYQFIISINCEFDNGIDPDVDLIVKEGHFDEIGTPVRYACYDYLQNSLDIINITTRETMHFNSDQEAEENNPFGEEYYQCEFPAALKQLLQKALDIQANNQEFDLSEVNQIFLFV